ncbi:MAG TPA: SprT-like domain-containing protein [Gemmatimonadaceae bacterium]|nr:SprT-like domain-containing protein [Gemmatimonadaceae bacterium]
MLQSLISRMRRPRRVDEAQLTLVLPDGHAPRDADDLLARLRAMGLRRITTCRLTRNRNVMVSFRGTELRVHQGYLAAPDDTLRAIVRFIEGRTRAERVRARRVLLEYPIPTDAATRRRRQGTHPEDIQMAERLAEWHRVYNERHFGGALRSITVRVSRRMRGRLGHYTPATAAGDPPEIAISRRHLRRHGWDEALETLLHEMVHQWQDEQGHPIDHGPVFRQKARAVGISPHARRTVAA